MGKWLVQPLGQAGSEKGSYGDSRWRWSREVIWKRLWLWTVSLGMGGGWRGSCSQPASWKPHLSFSPQPQHLTWLL